MLGLLSLAVAVKPLADIVAGYTCCDRHKESDEIFHALTSFLLPDWSGAAEPLYQDSTIRTRKSAGNAHIFPPETGVETQGFQPY